MPKTHRSTEAPKHRSTEAPKHRSTEAPKHRSTEAPKHRTKIGRALAIFLLAVGVTVCTVAPTIASVLNPEYAAGYDPETKIYRFQPGDLTVTAYYDDGTSRILSYDEYELEKPYVQNTGDLSQTVTINYTEDGVTVSDKFTVDVNLPIGKRGSITLNCNGGTIVPDENWTVTGQTGSVSTLSKSMIPYGSEITLPTTAPTLTGYEFVSWMNGTTGQEYNPGDSFEMTTTDAIILTAKWEQLYTVKYAVRLYGIKQDVDEYGNTLGLTFGPSGGYDGQKGIANQSLLNTYVCHDENDPMCLHNMTWEQIVDQSQKNPSVFQTCLENGCTHSVDLTISGPIAGTNYNGKTDNGDGASSLYGSLTTKYRRWNPTNNTTGGWYDSMIRNTLNGTNTTNSGTTYTALDETNCLLAMFPSVLQENIVAKQVISGTSSSRTSELATTYDKLWLFSSNEIYAPGGSQYNTDYIDNREGTLYQSQSLLNAVIKSRINLFYNEFGNVYVTLSRSLYGYAYIVYFHPSDYPYYTGASNTNGIAPGFCLK